jgi:hypothetical protein
MDIDEIGVELPPSFQETIRAFGPRKSLVSEQAAKEILLDRQIPPGNAIRLFVPDGIHDPRSSRRHVDPYSKPMEISSM